MQALSASFFATNQCQDLDACSPLLKKLDERFSAHQADLLSRQKMVRQTHHSDASVLVILTNEPNPKVLLTRRANHLNAHAGEVSFVGGKRESIDTDNLMTALREAYEEIKLPPQSVQILGQLSLQRSKSGLSVRPIVAVTHPDIQLTADSDEIARLFWVNLSWFLEQETIDYHISYTHGQQPVKLVTPSWQIEGEVIWGLTGRIIANLLSFGFDRHIPWYYRKQT